MFNNHYVLISSLTLRMISNYNPKFITEVLSLKCPLPIQIAHIIAVFIGKSHHMMERKLMERQMSLWQVTSVMGLAVSVHK